MTFAEFKSLLDEELAAHSRFELLEFSYVPYSFGSGLVAYRTSGKVLRFVYDGRDSALEVSTSKPHEKYPSCTWKAVGTYEGLDSFKPASVSEFL